MKFFVLAVCLGFLSVSAFAQDVLFEQTSRVLPSTAPHGMSVGISSSSTDALFEQSQAWDNFTLSEDVTVNALTWKGAFNNVFNPDGTLGENDFFVGFYPSVSNSPDVANPIKTFNLDGGLAGRNDGTDVTESTVPNEFHKAGGAIVNYSAEVEDFDLAAGEYWLSIQAIQTLPSSITVHDDPQWSWVFANSRGGVYSYDEAFGDRVKPGLFFGGIDATFSLLGPEEVDPGILGDFDNSEVLDVADIDLLVAAICAGDNNIDFDLTGDGIVDATDHSFWLSDLGNILPGDANLDREVGFVDFLLLSTNYGTDAGWGQGNFNTDKEVGFVDFLLLSNNYGKFSPTPAAAAVPEPAAVALMGIALLAVGYLRPRRA